MFGYAFTLYGRCESICIQAVGQHCVIVKVRRNHLLYTHCTVPSCVMSLLFANLYYRAKPSSTNFESSTATAAVIN